MCAPLPNPEPAPPQVHTLANGVRVICDPMPGLETLALSVVAGHGARSEDPARGGWSHLLEHMVFKGAGSRSARDIVEVIEAAGGSINAATGYERTSYQVRALKGGLDLGLAVTADLIQRPSLEAGDLAREKQVVIQEIAEAADAPDDLVFELAQGEAFMDQALGRPILGVRQTVEAATPQSLEAWRRYLYAPEALVISVAGAVDVPELLALADRDFGGAAAAEAAPTPSPARFVGGTKVTTKALEQANVVILMPAVSACDPDYFVLRIYAEILGGGMASRLFQEARERRGLAYAIDAYAETYADVGVLGIFAGCSARDAAELVKVSAGEIAGMSRHVEPAELARAKAQLKASMFMARESALARAEQAAGQVLLFGRVLTPLELAAAVDAVTDEDVMRLGERILADRRCAVAILGPRSAKAAGETFSRTLFGETSGS